MSHICEIAQSFGARERAGISFSFFSMKHEVSLRESMSSLELDCSVHCEVVNTMFNFAALVSLAVSVPCTSREAKSMHMYSISLQNMLTVQGLALKWMPSVPSLCLEAALLGYSGCRDHWVSRS